MGKILLAWDVVPHPWHEFLFLAIGRAVIGEGWRCLQGITAKWALKF
jgi:hypothetical protein